MRVGRSRTINCPSNMRFRRAHYSAAFADVPSLLDTRRNVPTFSKTREPSNAPSTTEEYTRVIPTPGYHFWTVSFLRIEKTTSYSVTKLFQLPIPALSTVGRSASAFTPLSSPRCWTGHRAVVHFVMGITRPFLWTGASAGCAWPDSARCVSPMVTS